MGKVVAKKAEKMDDGFLDVLSKNATKKKPAAKKSKGSAAIDVPAELKTAIDNFNAAKADKKKAEAVMKQTEPQIIEHVRSVQDADGFDGKYSKSYDVDGNETKVKFVTSNKFSINADDEDEIQELLGDDFDNLIDKNFNVTLKTEVMESKELQSELVNLIGAENFAKFFDTTVTLSVVDDYDKKVYDVVEKDDLDTLRMFVKQSKPSLR